MRVIPTELPGVVFLEPRVFGDARGFFVETWNQARYREAGLPAEFVQDNLSLSARGVLRGLHFQNPKGQGKLVTVISGLVFDVAVDVRRDSATFGRWHGVTLCGDEPRCLWVPPGFAHGLCVLSDVADVVYKCTELYAPEDESGVAWNDPLIGIEWPIRAPLLSPKDQRFPPLSRDRADLPSSH